MKDYEPWLDKIVTDQTRLMDQQNRLAEMLQYIIGFLEGAQSGRRQAVTPLDSLREAVRQANYGIVQDKPE